MSATYTLHVSPFAASGDAEALERADLVRDGFSWGAFLAPMLWFFRHRHWFLGLGALAIVLGLYGILKLAGFGPGAILAAEIVLHLLFGLEGSSLRRWAYAVQGRPAVDVVLAGSLEEAETKSFGRWLAEAERPRSTSPVRPGPTTPWRGREPVLGLFPDLEGRRT